MTKVPDFTPEKWDKWLKDKNYAEDRVEHLEDELDRALDGERFFFFSCVFFVAPCSKRRRRRRRRTKSSLPSPSFSLENAPRYVDEFSYGCRSCNSESFGVLSVFLAVPCGPGVFWWCRSFLVSSLQHICNEISSYCSVKTVNQGANAG